MWLRQKRFFSLLIFMSLLRYVTCNFEYLYTNVFFFLFAHLEFTLSPSLHYIPSFYSALLHPSLFYSNSILFHSNLLYSNYQVSYDHRSYERKFNIWNISYITSLLYYILLFDYSTRFSSALVCSSSRRLILPHYILLYFVLLCSSLFFSALLPSYPLHPRPVH